MATVVNNPSTGGSGLSTALILLFLFLLTVFLFFYYGLPALRGAGEQSMEVQIPEQVDVNVNTQQQP